MTGRITKLIDEQQAGIISADDGLEYQFRSGALIGVQFGALHLGARVTFVPSETTHRAAGVKLGSVDVERPR